MKPSPVRPRLSWRRRLLFAAAPALAILLAAESALRLSGSESFEFAHGYRLLHGYRRWSRKVLRPDVQVRLKLSRPDGSGLYDFRVSTDARGMRKTGDDRYAAGREIIHCVGDSFTMGWGVADEDAYPAALQRELGPSSEVLNLGIDGVGLLAAAEKSRIVGEELPPRQLVYLFCSNDPGDDELAREHRERSAPAHVFWELVDPLRRHLYILNIPFAMNWRRHFDAGPKAAAEAILRRSDGTEPLAGATADALRNLTDRCSSSGVRFLAVAIDDDEETLRFLALARDLGVERVVHPMGEERRIPGDGHLTREGNRELAVVLAARLRAGPAGAGTGLGLAR